MGLDLNLTIPAFTVFIQGILSFFSPCVLPLIPLYISYLSGGTMRIDENGQRQFDKKKVMINTLFFIIGVSFAFFLLGLGFSTAGRFFTDNQMMFSRIGGIIIILLGLIQLGFLDKPLGGKEMRLPIKVNTLNMNPLTALIMGFTFSFAWTPCVGPALSTVLIMVSSSSSQSLGIILMAVYTLGFTLPFLLVGLFTTTCLDFFKKHIKLVNYTIKIGGVLMILMGVMMITGVMNGVTGYLSTLGNNSASTSSSQANSTQPDISEEPTINNESDTSSSEDPTISSEESSEAAEEDIPEIPAVDFELKDQFGNTHTLADYEGKVIFLNFWATWCPPCVAEMPDIQKLYEDYGLNAEDVIILGVATPRTEANSLTQEGDEAHVVSFLADNGYTYPTIMDVDGSLVAEYGISAYPTTFMIDAKGNIFGYVPGMISYEIMNSIINQTLEGIRN